MHNIVTMVAHEYDGILITHEMGLKFCGTTVYLCARIAYDVYPYNEENETMAIDGHIKYAIYSQNSVNLH